MSYLIVELDGMRRTLRMPRRPIEVRLAPGRIVSIELQCTELFRELWLRPNVAVFWPRPGQGASPPAGADLWWTSRGLVPAGTEAPEPSLPGLDIWTRAAGPETLTFSIDITVPPGASTLVLEGPCGFAIRDIELSEGENPVAPIRFTLPQPDAGGLDLRLTGGALPSGEMGRYRVYVWDEHQFRRTVSFFDSASELSRGIPPGTYRLGSGRGPGCERVVEIQPGTISVVELDRRSCLVSWIHPLL